MVNFLYRTFRLVYKNYTGERGYHSMSFFFCFRRFEERLHFKCTPNQNKKQNLHILDTSPQKKVPGLFRLTMRLKDHFKIFDPGITYTTSFSYL